MTVECQEKGYHLKLNKGKILTIRMFILIIHVWIKFHDMSNFSLIGVKKCEWLKIRLDDDNYSPYDTFLIDKISLYIYYCMDKISL